MSEKNIELVRDLLEAFQQRDHERAFDFYDPDIEWDATTARESSPDLADVYRGHEGVRTYWRRWLSAWRDLEFEIQDVRAGEGDEVVAVIRNQRQWGRQTGIVTEIPPYGLVFTIRGGKVVRWRIYADHASALEAAGLEE